MNPFYSLHKMEQFKFELVLFLKVLDSYTKNVNEVDDETLNLLNETSSAIDKLKTSSTKAETPTTLGKQILDDLKNVNFKCNRYIECCLCDELIHPNLEDFQSHIQADKHLDEKKKLISRQNSEKIVKNCIKYSPLCYHLISYINSWQENNVATETDGLHLNADSIDVLVIYFLQKNSKLPQFKDLPSSQSQNDDSVPNISREELEQAFKDFLEFYTKIHEKTKPSISANINKLSSHKSHAPQTKVVIGPKKSKSSASHVLHCPNVEKPKVPSYHFFDTVNGSEDVLDITSSIQTIINRILLKEANVLKKICRIFASGDSYKKSIDEYVKRVIIIPSTSNISVSLPSNSTERPKITEVDYQNYTTTRFTVQNIKTYAEIEFNRVYSIISGKLDMLSNFTNSPDYKSEILKLFTEIIHQYDPSLQVSAFGSREYNLNEPGSNLNFFVHTSYRKPSKMFHKFRYDWSTNWYSLCDHFEKIDTIPGNRSLRQQVSVIHKKSGIRCHLLFDDDALFRDSPAILCRYIEKVPNCGSLIRFIRTWQTVLMEMYPESSIVKFPFNTYIISVLVIFFLQVKHNAPVVDDVWSLPNLEKDNLSNLRSSSELVRDFFSFYGNTPYIWNHIVSVHTGRWIEREPKKEYSSTSLAEQKLRDGIKSNPASWRSCNMFVQDLVRTDVNIMAEIHKSEAKKFWNLCQIFAKNLSAN